MRPDELYTLTDLIDVGYLQELQDIVSKTANLSGVILDSIGTPVTKMTNSRGICRLRGDPRPDGCICEEILEKLYYMALETNSPAFFTCPGSDLSRAAIPILRGEEFLGTWILGQARMRDTSEELFVSAANKMKIKTTSARKLLGYIPEFSCRDFEAIIHFISTMTNELVKFAGERRLGPSSEGREYPADALRAIVDTPDICIYVTDFYTGEILMCNSSYAGFFGLTPETAIGTRCFENIGYSSRCSFCPYEELLDQNGNPVPSYSWEHLFERYDITLQLTSRAIRWGDGRFANMAVGVDITRQKRMQNDLYELAFFDPALEIPNSACMEQNMRKHPSHEYLLAVKLTELGRINNLFGRACGDAVLKMVRDYIQKMNIPGATLYKGKLCDFCVLFENTGGDNGLPRRVADGIYNRCQKAWEVHVDDRCQNIFAAAAVCVVSLDFSHEHFFSYLYNLKAHSLDVARKKDSVILCDGALRESFDTGQKLAHSIRNNVNEGMMGFYVEYQPLVDARTLTWKGLEALCRWNNPEFGTVPPDVFIPVAEANGLIGSIGLWVLEQAVAQVKSWGLDKADGFILDVNLSPLQLDIPNLDQAIANLLEKYRYPPDKLGLEITESNELNLIGHTKEAVLRLSELGIGIVLDDFGTGYSSLSTLHKLPVKILKTDRSFITGMETDSYLQDLFCTLISLAHRAGILVVAEGVENDSQARFLLEQEADFLQGYFCSRPLSVKQLVEKLSNFK